MQTKFTIAEIFSEPLSDDVRFDMLMQEVIPIVSQLINKYEKKLEKIMDTSDIKQICMIELYKTIKSFDVTIPNSFYSYYKVCAERAILKNWKMHRLDKRKAIFLAESLDRETKDNSGLYGIDLVENNIDEYNPTYNMELYRLRSIVKKIELNLSPKEAKIFTLYTSGYSYKVIAKILCESEKKVDNTIQKIRKIYRPML